MEIKRLLGKSDVYERRYEVYWTPEQTRTKNERRKAAIKAWLCNIGHHEYLELKKLYQRPHIEITFVDGSKWLMIEYTKYKTGVIAQTVHLK